MVSFNTNTLKHVDVIEVSGRLDSSNAEQFDEVFKGYTDNKRYKLVLDLSAVTYMSSAPMRAMVSALRTCTKNSGNVHIANPSERVQEVLSLAGFDSVFKVYKDQLAAVGDF